MLGVTGSIAAYKALELLRLLRREGASVQVVMSEGAKNFVSPLSFATLSGKPVLERQFGRMRHIALGKADAFVIAPATANFIAKASVGIADDLLTSSLQAFEGPVVVSPAMNDAMYRNQALRKNISRLRGIGYVIVEPDCGELACGTNGKGRLAELGKIVGALEAVFAPNDLKGKTVLVTAGPTREFIDPIRFISNASSGRMGYAFAEAAARRGAEVVLVSGPTSLEPPAGVKVEAVETTAEMFASVRKFFPMADLFVSAAAPADFSPSKRECSKVQKSRLKKLALKETVDIAAWCGRNKKKQKVVAFALETAPFVAKAKKKLTVKNADLVVLNTPENLQSAYAKGTLVFADGRVKKLKRTGKQEFADAVISRVMRVA